MTEPEIIYRFTPQFDGAFLRNVPQRDLTQADVDRMSGEQRRDAFTPHPAYGTPLFTAVEEHAKAEQEKAIASAEKAEAKAEKAAKKDGDA